MAEERLEIILDAQTQQATKAIADFAKTVGVELNGAISVYEAFDKKIRETQTALKAASDPAAVIKLTNELKNLEQGFSKIKAGTLGNGITGIGKAAANATPALTNFGRVLQDAPFGIIGIANNIDPLISSFQALQKSTGSTGGALKALFAGLAGPAGIAIAVSAATSAFIAFGPQIKDFISNFGKTNALTKETREEITKLAEAAAKELVTFGKLTGFIADSTRPLSERKKAIEELRKQYGPYLKDLTDEEILIGNTTKAYDAAIESILRKATVKGLEKEIEKEIASAAEKILTIERQSIENEQRKAAELNKSKVEYDRTGKAAAEAYIKAQQGGRLVGEVNTDVAKTASLANQAYENTPVKQITRIREQLMKSVEPLLKLTDGYKDLGIKGREAAAATGELGFNLDELFKSIGTFTQFQKTGGVVTTAYTAQLNALAKAADAVFISKQKNLAIDKQAAIAGAVKPVGAIQRGLDPAILKLQADAASQAAAQTEAFAVASSNAAVANQLLSPAIDSVFAALQSDDPFGTLLDGLKQFVIGLIKAVAQALILQAILAAFSGGASAAGGAAAGGGFLGKLGGILGFRANGGPVGAGSPYVVGDSGPELFVPQTSGNIVPNMALSGGGGTLSATVSGNDLLFILNQAGSNRRNNFG